MNNQITEKMRQLGASMSRLIDATPAAQVSNSDLLGGLTVEEVRAGVTKEMVGLSHLRNFPAASAAEARAGTATNRYMTPAAVATHLDQLTSRFVGDAGDLLYSDGSQFTLGKLMSRLSVVNTSAELDAQLNLVESFETVFNTWKRISHAGDTTYPANVSETQSWSYDAATDKISCTVNSSTLVGFVSPQAYGDFTFEVNVGSVSGDDDSIGICFGFVEENGKEHTLTALRTPGGSQTHPSHSGVAHKAKLFDVYYDIFSPSRRDLGSKNGGLMWGDGVVDDNRVLAGDIGSGGWGAHPAGCKIKAVRVGDIITLSTTNLGGGAYVPTANVIVDLAKYPELEKFRGRIRVGYVAYSQPSSSWTSLVRPGERSGIVDARDLSVREWDGSTWKLAAAGAHALYFKPGRFYHNAATGKTYYAERQDKLIHVMG